MATQTEEESATTASCPRQPSTGSVTTLSLPSPRSIHPIRLLYSPSLPWPAHTGPGMRQRSGDGWNPSYPPRHAPKNFVSSMWKVEAGSSSAQKRKQLYTKSFLATAPFGKNVPSANGNSQGRLRPRSEILSPLPMRWRVLGLLAQTGQTQNSHGLSKPINLSMLVGRPRLRRYDG